MAYSKADLSAADLALAADDKPILLGENWMRDATDVDWRQSGSFTSGTDAPAADGPTSYAYDDFSDLQTYPATSQTTWYLIVDLGASAPGIIDSVAILNHNLGTIGSVQTDIQIDDNSDFSTAITIATQTPTTDKRLVFLDLDDAASPTGNPNRFSSVRYFRIKFSKGSAIQPKIGEVIISRRRQLKHKSNLPWDPYALETRLGRFESSSGKTSDYVYYKKRRVINAVFSPHESAHITDLETFYDTDTDGGRLPFLWIEDPNTTPTDAYWMKMDPPELSGPLQNWTERLFAIRAKEHGPNFLGLGT